MPASAPRPLRPAHRPRLAAAAAALGAVASAAGCSGSTGTDATSGPTVTVTRTAGVPAQGTPSAPAGTAEPASAAPDRAILDPNADLGVDDQSGTGHSVRVKDVAISAGTAHIAIYAESGRLLGTARVGPTVRRATVQLSVPVPRTSELLAVLYGDDGDRRFERADPRISDADGELYDDTFDYRLLR